MSESGTTLIVLYHVRKNANFMAPHKVVEWEHLS